MHICLHAEADLIDEDDSFKAKWLFGLNQDVSHPNVLINNDIYYTCRSKPKNNNQLILDPIMRRTI